MNLFDIPKLEKELKELEEQTTKQEFWDDTKNSTKVLAKIKSLKNKSTEYRKIEEEINNLIELSELLELEPEEEMAKEVLKNTKKAERELEKLHLATLLSGKYDSNNAIVTIHPGAGGTESQDWAEMLYRMYTRYAERKGFKIEVLDYLV